MSEAELRERLRDAVADEPPLDFDPDALICRAQTVRRRRWTLAAAGVATAALTASVLLLPGALTPRETSDALSESVLTTTPSAVAPTTYRTKATLPPLADYITKRFEEVVPGVAGVRTEFLDVGAPKPAPGYLIANVYFTDRVGSGVVEVRFVGSDLVPDAKVLCSKYKCDAMWEQEDGSVVEYAMGNSADPGMVVYTVAHFRTDGSVVEVVARNSDASSPGRLRPGLPVTPVQMVELVTDPVISLD